MVKIFTKFLIKVTCVVSMLLTTLIADLHAQHYTFTASSGTFVDLAAPTPVDDIERDDQISQAIPIGFSFSYFGNTYTELLASSNGFVTFNMQSGYNNGNNMPSNYYKMIAPLWDDLGGEGCQAGYATTGTTGSRIFTFEWKNWQWRYNAVAGISFQVKLYETSNKIEFIYRQESGALRSPSASIGMIGNTFSQFYSLSNTSATPVLDNGTSNINTKPATGQMYTFTPSTTTITTPTVQASNVTASANDGKSMALNWVKGNGSYRVVFVKQTASIGETPTLEDEKFYVANTAMYTGSTAVGSGWHCVYNGSVETSVTVTNLKMGLPYLIFVLEYNGSNGTQKYLKTTATGNPAIITTALTAPTTPISRIRPLRISGNEATIDLAEGSGEKRAIFITSELAATTAPAVNNTTYVANTAFGLGSRIGTTGWYCIFNGASNADFLTLTGLSGNKTYTIHAVDYNGPAGAEKYFSSTGTNNPLQMTTFSDAPSLPYAFGATTSTFTPIAGTLINSIKSNDALSPSLPIGFTFNYGGSSFTTLVASSNGLVTFNPYVSDVFSYGEENDLTNSLLRPLIAPLWDNLNGSSGQASYTTTGTSPNRVFTIEYLNMSWNYNASTAGISFQLKLYETTNKIEFIYRNETGVLESPSASIGLAFPNLGSGNFLSLTNASATPVVSTTQETLTIDSKPANNQAYSFTPTKLNQSITFPALPQKLRTDPAFSLTATASSTLAITYTSSNPAVATVSGNVVTIVGIGTTTITASQAGDGIYNAASVSRNLVVTGQTISFYFIPAKTFGDAAFSLEATSTSGLPVTFSSPSDKISIIGNQVTMLKPGAVTVMADQAGDLNTSAAPQVTQVFCINPAKPTVTVNGLGTQGPVLTSSSALGNQWLRNGIAISGETNPTFTAKEAGVSYSVIVSADNCTSLPSDPQMFVITGVEKEEGRVTVSPNPTENHLIVDVTSLQSVSPVELALYDMAGHVVHSTTGNGAINLNLHSLPVGIYLLKIKSDKDFIVKKVMKK